ncbi:MAG TPA: hypothetical protein VFB41_07575 [Solirubrobacteraceae bacterium]|nr:hypothetical protein [Solirubrobacteraceae bacterium]
MLAATFTTESRPDIAIAEDERPAAAAFAVFPPAAPVADYAPAGESPAEEAPRHGTRRYAHGELLLAAFIGARRPLTFEDLAGVLADTGARVSELVGWMASSQANGLIESEGYQLDPVGMPLGPRLFTLSDEAREELRARRGRRRTRAAA